LRVLQPYEEALKGLPRGVPVVFATLTIPNGWDVRERIEFAFRSLTKLYELRPFGKRKFKEVKRAFYEELREYARNLKARGYSPKVIRRKVRLQKKLFKKFVNRYRNLPGVERLKLGQLVPALWVFELTKSPEGYHPHWHGIVLAEVSKVLLTVLWKIATRGEAYITDVRKVSNVKEALQYVEDYLADGFVDIGEGPESLKDRYEEMVAIEEALHGRRKVRAWGFDLMRGQQFGQKTCWVEEKTPYIWVHSYGLKLDVVKRSGRVNLHDYWSVRRKARKEGKKVPYIVAKVRDAKGLFGRELFLLGFMRPDGLIRLEPVSGEDREFWEELLVGLFDYKGSVGEFIGRFDYGWDREQIDWGVEILQGG
jgi:hypothetical protein